MNQTKTSLSKNKNDIPEELSLDEDALRVISTPIDEVYEEIKKLGLTPEEVKNQREKMISGVNKKRAKGKIITSD